MHRDDLAFPEVERLSGGMVHPTTIAFDLNSLLGGGISEEPVLVSEPCKAIPRQRKSGKLQEKPCFLQRIVLVRAVICELSFIGRPIVEIDGRKSLRFFGFRLVAYPGNGVRKK